MVSTCSLEDQVFLLPNVYALGFRAGKFVQSIWTETYAYEPPTWKEVWTFVTNSPALYKSWWVNLYYNDPVHVVVETTLLLSILYILFSRSKDWRDERKEKFSAKEEQELLKDWKRSRAPLTPTLDNDDSNEGLPAVVVHKMAGRTLDITTPDNPTVSSVLNFATFDFLGMAATLNGSNPVKKAAREALERYGCGSCGPRGFYGTVDVHLHLERQFAKFLRTHDSILYSDGASACSSTVAAFCKRGDLIVADEGLYEPLKTGISLSRAHVKWFKHNDMNDLRDILSKVRDTDKKLGRPVNAQRRFLVVEGLYKNSGTICPLDELVRLKHEFSYRLILDESFSFGTLGKTGRGIAEEYGCKLMHDAEIITVGLENSMGSVGGITVGTEEIVDHQRLSGSGYCFSASSPPFTASAAMAALEIMQTDSDLLQRLTDNRTYLYEKLKGFCESLEDLLLVTSDERSPICLLQVADIPETEYLDDLVFLREVVKESLSAGCAFSALEDTPTQAPAIRLTVNAAHTFEDIETALNVLRQSVDEIMNRFHEEVKED